MTSASAANGMLRPRLDILPPPQRRFWPDLRPLAELGYVLYGGTAIALRLGHRVSVDFDFFTDRALDRARLQSALGFMAHATVLQDQMDTLSVSVPADNEDAPVRISFFANIGFGRVGEPERSEDGVLQIASPEDLLATKLKVLLQRIEAKDYRDVAALLASGVGLERGLAAAKCLFGQAFQPSESLKALVYFEGGDLQTLAPEDKDRLIRAASAVGELPHLDIRSRELTSAIG